MCRLIFLLVKALFAVVMVLIITLNLSAAVPGTEYEIKRVKVWSNPSVDANRKTDVINHKISIEFFPEKHSFMALDEILVRNEGEFISLNLNKSFKIISVKQDGKELKFHFDTKAYQNELKKLDDDNLASDFSRAGILKIDTGSAGEHTVILDYEGSVYEEPAASQFTREYIASQTSGIISEQGAFLSPESFWYPRGDERMSRFEVRTTTPIGYETVTQGTRESHEIKGSKLIVKWKNIQPSDSIYLQAGPYEIQEDEIDGIKIYTYFFPGDKELASLYMSKSKQYIAMYNRLLGQYPYGKFAVVENFFETGYGMPSWTLLGRTVVRLPFIPDTSLPHEICHNWWGNGVFVDYSQGNWCEGLTVYCADYLLKKKTMPGGDVDYRRQINRDYASYVKKNNDFPLTEFRSRHDPATRSVGYGKAMMVFHQLQRMMGEDKFFNSLRRLMAEYRFKKANWKDVLGIFEKECSLKLDNFYDSWVERTGAPVLRLENVKAVKQGKAFAVSFNIVQEGGLYDLDVPVLVKTEREEIGKSLSVSDSIEEFKIILDSKPVCLEVDPEHHLFRRLYPQEIPPSIAKVFGSGKQLIVLPSGADAEKLKKYRAAAQMINKTKTAVIKIDTEVKSEELDASSVILFHNVSERTVVADFLRGILREAPWKEDLTEKDDSGSVVVYDHPKNDEYGVMVIKCNRESDVLSIARKLPHYGKYSYLLFQGATNVSKGIWEVESSPLIYVFK